MSESYVADALGTPESWEFEGESYDVVKITTTGIIGRLERYCARVAFKQANDLKPSLDELTGDDDEAMLQEVYAEAMRSARELVASGHFKYGNRGYYQVLSSETGFEEALYWSVKFHSPRFTRAIFERARADKEAYSALLEIFERLNQGKKSTPPPTTEESPAIDTTPANSAG